MRLSHLLSFCLLFLAAFPISVDTKATVAPQNSFQPPEERKAQELPPQAKDPVWGMLSKTKIKVDKDKATYSAFLTEEVIKLNGQTLPVSGFIILLYPTEQFKHFLLSKRTPTCPYCQPGAPNEIIEVFVSKGIAWTQALSSFEGRLS